MQRWTMIARLRGYALKPNIERKNGSSSVIGRRRATTTDTAMLVPLPTCAGGPCRVDQ